MPPSTFPNKYLVSQVISRDQYLDYGENQFLVTTLDSEGIRRILGLMHIVKTSPGVVSIRFRYPHTLSLVWIEDVIDQLTLTEDERESIDDLSFIEWFDTYDSLSYEEAYITEGVVIIRSTDVRFTPNHELCESSSMTDSALVGILYTLEHPEDPNMIAFSSWLAQQSFM